VGENQIAAPSQVPQKMECFSGLGKGKLFRKMKGKASKYRGIPNCKSGQFERRHCWNRGDGADSLEKKEKKELVAGRQKTEMRFTWKKRPGKERRTRLGLHGGRN